MQTPKETNHEKDTNRYKLSLASDINVEESYFFSCRVKVLS